jgi:glycerate dehydrogenase
MIASITYIVGVRAVFLDFGTVSNGDLDTGPLERVLPGLVIHEQTPSDQVAARVAGFEAVLANKAIIDGATIARNPGLRIIALTATASTMSISAARASSRSATCATIAHRLSCNMYLRCCSR